MKTLLRSIFVCVCLVGLNACGSGDTGTSDGNIALGAQLQVVDQNLGDSKLVRVNEVESIGPGWVVIFTDLDGAPAEILGHTAVPSGVSFDVDVRLARDVVVGEKLFAILYTDAGTVSVFEPDVYDLPATNNLSQTVQHGFLISAIGDDPDVILSLRTQGNTSYFWEVLQRTPTNEGINVNPALGNSFITFTPGVRYEIQNLSAISHPLQFIGLDKSEDRLYVALSQGSVGRLENDPAVNWQELSDGRIRFTFLRSMTGVIAYYECSIHPEMAGVVTSKIL